MTERQALQNAIQGIEIAQKSGADLFTDMFVGTKLNTTSPLCTYKGVVMRLCDIPNTNNYAWRCYRGLTSLADWNTIP